MRAFEMVSDKYGEPHETTPEQFLTDCAELGWKVKLGWHTDGDSDWYTDQNGDVVLEATSLAREGEMKTYHSDRLGEVTIPEGEGKRQTNTRLSMATRQKLDDLTRIYGTLTEALAVAIEHLWDHDCDPTPL